MMTPAPTSHDVWFGSAIIARALKDGLDDESARAWFTPGEEFNHVCAMTGKSPAAVQALASDIFRRGDQSIVDRLIASAEKRAINPECMRRNTSAIDELEEDQPFRVKTSTFAYNGQSLTLPEWSERTGIPKDVIRGRMINNGWTFAQAIEMEPRVAPFGNHRKSFARIIPPVAPPVVLPPVETPKPRLHVKDGKVVAVSYDGSGPLTLKQWASRAGIPYKKLRNRLNCRWTFIEAIRKNKRGIVSTPARKYEYKGKRYSIPQLAKLTGVNKGTIYKRLCAGHTIEACTGDEKSKFLRFKYEINGERLTATEWCERYGVNRNTVYSRLRKGLPLEKALTFKVNSAKHTYNGQSLTLSEWARRTGIPRNALDDRLRRLKWTFAQAIEAEPRPALRGGHRRKSHRQAVADALGFDPHDYAA